jgi:hypothetical protein
VWGGGLVGGGGRGSEPAFCEVVRRVEEKTEGGRETAAEARKQGGCC